MEELDILETGTIIVTDDQGNEVEFEILFTFESDDTNKTYVLYFNPAEEEPKVYSSIYDNEGNLFPIETPEEWDMIEEVYNSFMADEEDEG